MAEILTGVSPFAPNLVLETTPEWHLARRSCVAATAQVASEITKIGYEKWIDQQLHWENINDDEYEKDRARLFEAYGMSDEEILSIAGGGTQPYRSPYHWMGAVLHEQWKTKRQLKASMLSFMLDTINVEWKKGEFGFTRHLNILRDLCLGKYTEILKAAYSGYGLHMYLDNISNTKAGINENLGREMLELHTIGTVYTQDDVMSAAKLLSGYKGGYSIGQHYMGEVTVFGKTFKNQPKDGYECLLQVDELLEYLARHRATAEHIAKRLCLYYVTDNPSQNFINSLADTYIANDTDLRPVLKKLFMSNEFKQSVGQKIRRPQQLQASVWATGGVEVQKGHKSDLVNSSYPSYWNITQKYIENAGHAPMTWLYPDGFSLKSENWISTSLFLTHLSLDSCMTPGDDLLTTADFAKNSGIVVNKDTWNVATTKMFEYITGWKVNDSDFKKPAAGLAALNTSLKAPNMLTKPANIQTVNSLAVPVLRSPFMFIS